MAHTCLCAQAEIEWIFSPTLPVQFPLPIYHWHLVRWRWAIPIPTYVKTYVGANFFCRGKSFFSALRYSLEVSHRVGVKFWLRKGGRETGFFPSNFRKNENWAILNYFLILRKTNFLSYPMNDRGVEESFSFFIVFLIFWPWEWG